MQINPLYYNPQEPQGEDDSTKKKSNDKSDSTQDFKKRLKERQQKEQMQQKREELSEEESQPSPHDLSSKKNASKNIDQSAFSKQTPLQEGKKEYSDEAKKTLLKSSQENYAEEKQPIAEKKYAGKPLSQEEQASNQFKNEQDASKQSIFDLFSKTKKAVETLHPLPKGELASDKNVLMQKKESPSKGSSDAASKSRQVSEDKTSELKATQTALDAVKEKDSENKDKHEQGSQAQQGSQPQAAMVQTPQQIEIKGQDTKATVEQTNAKDLSSLIEKMYVHVDKMGTTSTLLTLKSLDGNVTEIQITQRPDGLNIQINTSNTKLLAEIAREQGSIISTLKDKQINVHTLECSFKERKEPAQSYERVEGTEGESNT